MSRGRVSPPPPTPTPTPTPNSWCAQVASERQSLQLLLAGCLNEMEVFGKLQPLLESVMAQEAAEQAMEETIEREKNTTAAVRQLRNDLREEKLDHEEKVRTAGLGRCLRREGSKRDRARSWPGRRGGVESD